MSRQLRNPKIPVRLAHSSPGSRRDVESRDVVGGSRMAARPTAEKVSALSVLLFGMPTSRTFPASISRIDLDHGNTSKRCLVGDKETELGETPVEHPVFLTTPGLDPFADPLQFFEGDSAKGALRSINDVLGDDMVSSFLEPGLLPGDSLELSSSGSRPVALKVPPPVLELPPILFEPRSAVDLPVAVDGEVDDAQIDAQELLNVSFFRRLDVAGTANIEGAPDEHQVNFALAVLEQCSLMVSTNVVDLEPTAERPDGNPVATHDAKDAIVVGLGGVLTKGPLLALEGLIGVGDLGDATSGDLGAQTEAASDLVVDELVDVIGLEGLGFPSLSGDPVASLVARLERRLECGVLLVCGHELDVGHELHVLQPGTKEIECQGKSE